MPKTPMTQLSINGETRFVIIKYAWDHDDYEIVSIVDHDTGEEIDDPKLSRLEIIKLWDAVTADIKAAKDDY